MRLVVPREITAGETRVAVVPETAAKLAKLGFEVVVESGAGSKACFTDAAYAETGASLASDPRALYEGASLVLKVREPAPQPALGVHEADLIPEGAVLIAFLGRDPESEIAKRLAARRVTAFAFERIPRTSRAQRMDALSSMSTVAGYRAILIAANAAGRFFPLLMTAAGTIAPARVFVLGAGVAGLQCIATARRLGGVVEAFDVRPAVKEEVQSLGATFVGLDLASEESVAAGGYAKELTADHQAKERALIAERIKNCDIVVTTAMVPSGRAPVLITRAMVESMKSGSVIVDIAADGGGNCELTRPGEIVHHGNVSIHGPVNLAATLPTHASQMLARNALALVQHLVKDGRWNLDDSDDIVRDTCLVRGDAAGAETANAGARA